MKKVSQIFLFSLLLTSIPLSISWIHHQLVTGLNPFLAIVIMPLTLIVGILLFVLLFKLFKRYVNITPAVLFLTACFSFLVLGLLRQIYFGNSALDIHLSNTYYIDRTICPVAFAAIGFGIFSAIYCWLNRSFCKQMNSRLGLLHFWITFLTVSFLVLPSQYEGLAGMPRRYYDFDNGTAKVSLPHYNSLATLFFVLLMIGQLLFVYELFISKGKKFHPAAS